MNTEEIIEKIRIFVERVQEPEKWRIVIPIEQYEDVVESLDTVKELGRYYKDASICYSDTREEVHIEYSSTLSEHMKNLDYYSNDEYEEWEENAVDPREMREEK